MRLSIAIALLCCGVWFFQAGWRQKDSLLGLAQGGLARTANRIDGGGRMPKHSWYMLGGGALVIAGAGLIFAGRGGR